MKNKNTQKLTLAAMVAAAYAVLSLLGAVFGITYGPIPRHCACCRSCFRRRPGAWAWAASSPTCSAPMECWISWWGPWLPLLPR